jgi:hypothetical protein
LTLAFRVWDGLGVGESADAAVGAPRHNPIAKATIQPNR